MLLYNKGGFLSKTALSQHKEEKMGENYGTILDIEKPDGEILKGFEDSLRDKLIAVKTGATIILAVPVPVEAPHLQITTQKSNGDKIIIMDYFGGFQSMRKIIEEVFPHARFQNERGTYTFFI